jgi:PAS domain S-box-containing protein
VFNDVTERDALEVKLAAERDYLQLLMQTTMTGIVALDAEGRVIFANAEAGKLTRTPPERMIGIHHADLFPPQAAPAPGVACFESVIRTEGRQRGLQVGIRRADGAERMLSINVARIDRPGVEARVVCALADITEELETARTLDAARARAEAANRTKSQFLANMSHEIRTPLNGVLGMAEVLEEAANDAQTRAMARTIRDSGETLLSILNDVLDMSKIEAGKMQIETVPFDPAQIATRIRALHVNAAHEKGLTFDVTGPAPGAPARLGDPHRILQVVHNLVGNAIKFTETGGVRVAIRAAADGPVTIEVHDTGIGMTPEQSARIFAEFEQGDGSVARRFGGTGLGMAITKALVEQMQGEITLDTRPGRGTCVRVVLPLAGAEDAGRATPDLAADPRRGEDGPPLSGLSLLAADDNATNRMVLTLMLERAGARVHAVEGGQAALASWRPGDFDLVLLDISMPDMDGVATLAALRDKAARLGAPPPMALAITANVMTHQIAEYRAAGFAGHAGKPFQSAALSAEVARAADLARRTGRGRLRQTAAE